jgi:cytoskeleton protein RodZ
MNAEAGGETRPAAPDEPVTPGELLRRERERRSLTVQQAAEDLHLDTWMIEALEANRFLALGAPVYAKGHLRKYATLLGLSPASILERYEALADTPAEPTPIPASIAAPPVPERRSMKVPLWMGIALLMLAIVWGVVEVWTDKRASSEPPAPVDVAPEAAPAAAVDAPRAGPAESPAEATSASAVAADASGTAGPAPAAAVPREQKPSADSRDETVAAVAARQSEPAAAGSDVVRLRLEFSEASWTEIYDATGNRLMFDTGAPGRVRSVSGVAPLRVTLGYASGVTLHVNDRPLAIPRRPGKDAARFTLAADGSVTL